MSARLPRLTQLDADSCFWRRNQFKCKRQRAFVNYLALRIFPVRSRCCLHCQHLEHERCRWQRQQEQHARKDDPILRIDLIRVIDGAAASQRMSPALCRKTLGLIVTTGFLTLGMGWYGMVRLREAAKPAPVNFIRLSHDTELTYFRSLTGVG